MAKKKSQAQIRRSQQRAAARGETYQLPIVEEQNEVDQNAPSKEQDWMQIAERLQKEIADIEASADLASKDRRSAKRKAEAIASEEVGVPVSELFQWYEKKGVQQGSKSKVAAEDDEINRRETAAAKLKKALEDLEQNQGLKAKDRRSAKRKAEAIAIEETGMQGQELIDWYDAFLKSKKGLKSSRKRTHDPYIAFVGQLSYETTKEKLYQHIDENLKNDFKFKKSDVKIRILTDEKTRKSRGMAFVEVSDPELLYGLLKLHQTSLNGRRINVERSAGGKKNSEARRAKIAQYRKEQEEYFAEVVENILKEYKDTGELREGELDEGVVTLCKRHAGPVVRAAVAEYMEKGGRDMDNPSAYLTFLVTKFATEGVRDGKEDQTNTKASQPKRKNNASGPSSDKKFKQSSEFAKAGVDMSLSQKPSAGESNLTKVFPSARRGRGRGYM